MTVCGHRSGTGIIPNGNWSGPQDRAARGVRRFDGAVKDSGLIIVTTQEAGTDPVLMDVVLTQVRGRSPS